MTPNYSTAKSNAQLGWGQKVKAQAEAKILASNPRLRLKGWGQGWSKILEAKVEAEAEIQQHSANICTRIA